MTVVAVVMIGAGIYLMYYAWENHQANKTSPTAPSPITHVTQQIQGAGQGVQVSPAIVQPGTGQVAV